MLYREPFVLSIPQEIIDDARLSWTHRIAWAFIVKAHSKGEGACNEEVQNRLNIGYRRLVQIKATLERCGHLQKTGTGTATRYYPVNREAEQHSLIREFIKLSTCGFAAITEGEILELETRLPAEKILHTLEVLEWTYRKSNKKINKPIHMLRNRLKTGVTPDDDYMPRYWKEEAAKAAERAAVREQQRRENIERERAAERERQERNERERIFAAYLDAITPHERDILRARAIHRIKSNGGLVPLKAAQERQIKNAMMKIHEEGATGHANA